MKLVSAKPRSPNPYYALRQLVRANENYQKTFHTGWQVPRMSNAMSNMYIKLTKEPRPHSKNMNRKLRFAGLQYRMYDRTPARRRILRNDALAARTKAQKHVNTIYGKQMVGPGNAASILTLAELRAALTIAKALASSPVMRRVEGKRRARNFIREELSLYRRPNSTVRPSNVKARRINSVL
jgi:hypothetical protein